MMDGSSSSSNSNSNYDGDSNQETEMDGVGEGWMTEMVMAVDVGAGRCVAFCLSLRR